MTRDQTAAHISLDFANNPSAKQMEEFGMPPFPSSGSPKERYEWKAKARAILRYIEADALMALRRSPARRKADSDSWEPDPIQSRLSALYGRRNTTPWNAKEQKDYKALNIQESDLKLVEKAHKDGWEYGRNALQTLLNNWTEEVDKARTHLRKSKSGPSGPETLQKL